MSPEQNKTKPATRKKRPLWLKILLILLAAVLLLIALGPTIVSTSEFRKLVVRKINQSIKGQLSIDSWSIGWFTGVKIQGLSLADEDSEPIAEIKSVSLNPSYLSLLGQNPRLGKINVDSPVVDIHFDSQWHTNLEKLDGASPEPSGPSPGPSQLSLDVQITEGVVRIHSTKTATLSIQNINASAQMLPSGKPVSFELSCDLTDARGQGKIEAEGSIPRRDDGSFASELVKATAKVSVKGLNLQLLSPLLQRAGLELTTAGQLDLQGHVRMDGLEDIELECQANSAEIILTGDHLQSDELHLRNLLLDAQVQRSGTLLSLKKLRLDSDLINLQTSGTMHVGSVEELSELSSASLEGKLRADLPKILNQLPSTSHFQPGLKITRGELSVNYTVRTNEGSTELLGSAVVGNLQGRTAQRIIQLAEPIGCSFDLTQSKQHDIQIRKLSANSGFGSFSASGKISDLRVHCELDLAELNRQMSQFIDLRGADLAGELLCDGQLSAADDRLAFKLNLTGTNIVLAGVTARDLREGQLRVILDGSVTRNENNELAAISVKQAQLISEHTQLQFSGQIDPEALAVTGQLQLEGDLPSLGAYVGQFIDLGELDLAGRIICNANISTQERQLNFQANLKANELVISGLGGRELRESQLQLTAEGSVTRRENNKIAALSFKQAQLATDTTQLQFSGNCNLQPLAVTGKLQLEGDLPTLQTYVGQFVDLGKLDLAGQIACDADISTQDGRIDFLTKLTAQNLLISGLAGQPIREGQLQFKAQGFVGLGQENQVSSISFKQAQLISDGTELQFSGQIDPEALAVTGELQLKGDLSSLGSYAAQFTDLGKVTLAGQLLCQANITAHERQLSFRANLKAEELVISGLESSEIREALLQLVLDGSVTRGEDNKITSLSFKQAQLVTNQVQLQFSGQIDPEALAVTGQAQIKADLARLQALAMALDSFPDEIKQLQGQLESELTLSRAGPRMIGCEGQSNVQGLSIVRKTGQTVHEPSASLEHKLTYNLDTGILDGELGQLKLSGLSGQFQKLTLGPGQSGKFDLQKTRVSFTGDFGLLNPWLVAFANLDPKVELGGQFSGRASYSRQGLEESFAVDSQILNLRLRPPDRAAFVEPKITLQAEGRANRVGRTLELSRLDVSSGFLQVKAQVATGLYSGASPAKISLQARSDLAKLSRVMQPWFNDWPDLVGSGSANMTLTGSPGSADWIASLSGPAVLHIDKQELWGVSLGPTDIAMQVRRGQLHIPPSSIAANEGRINFQARVSLTEAKPFLVIPEPIKLIEDVAVNAQMSDALLKFVNPVFADNNEVSGTINFICNRLLVDDLAKWKMTTEMSGLFSGKDLRFQPRKGLMANLGSVLGADMSSELGEMRPVSIELANGIISYKDMHLVFANLIDLSFSGEIGLTNESLNMQVGIPILPSMLTNHPELSDMLAGKRIYVPIRGTVSKPEFDAKKFPELLLKAIADAVGEQIPKQIGNILENIFK